MTSGGGGSGDPETVGGEARRLLKLAWPVALAQAATMLMGLVDLLMVGRVGPEALAAVGLANPLVFGTLIPAMSLVLGIEPLIAQAHGAGNGPAAARSLQRGVLLAAVLSLPVLATWVSAEEILLALGQEPAIAHDAQRYMWVQAWSVPFFMLSASLRSYLQAREIVRPAMVVVAVANVFNAFFNWVLIFGNLGAPELGLVGAGIATGLTRALSFVALLLIVWRMRLYAGAWVPWSRSILDRRAFRQILALGSAIAIQTSLEMWAFNAANFIAGRIGTTALAAHLIVMNMASISFMVVMGVAQATSIRVGNLLGAVQPKSAQRAAWLGIGMGASLMLLAATGFITGRELLPRAYTPDLALAGLAATILPFAAAFQVFDGTQAVCCGVLRGMGRPLPAAVVNFVGYWLLALPLGGWLALRTDAGLSGLWLGLTVGLVIVAVALTAFIGLRGPKSARALESRA